VTNRTCAACGLREATVRDVVLRGGAAMEIDLCAECARHRRSTLVPLFGAALTAVALAAGAAIAAGRPGGAGGGAGDWTRRLRGGAPTLAQFSRDLTAAARAGELDPVIGREAEVERTIAILSRRGKNNPVLVGEPGVGKTAVVEGLAQRIVAGEVPAGLRDKRVLALSLGPLVAGTKYRGEFETRVKRILEEIRRSAREIVLFIDELHTLVGAGAAEGSLDLSSMIKPELARGELQCIGATTFDEYRRYIEADAALERRFQPVMVAEPTVEQTETILRGIVGRYGTHHGVAIDDAALVAAASLAARYITERFLPDKAIDLVDEAAASVALRGGSRVAAADVSAIVSKWTGIPQGDLTGEETRGLLALEARLAEAVVGQDAAIARVAEAVRRGRAGLKDPRRPLGSFLFVGPSGVGKTALARTLAAHLFGTEDALVRIDLSEYTEQHAVSRLLGAPPGYAGHEEAGQLSEPVRRRPYSVVLLDEFEKAHPDVGAVLLQVLDDGRLTDAKGRLIDFRNALVVLTANADPGDLSASLRPELLDRLDEIVCFAELGLPEIEAIVDVRMAELARRLDARNAKIVLSPEARRFLAQESLTAGDGARHVARTLAKHVTTPLSSAVLRGDLRSGGTARVDLRGKSVTVVPDPPSA